MKIRVTIIYTFGDPPDGHEIWLEKTWIGIVPPFDQETLDFGCKKYEATFKIENTRWYPLEDEFSIILEPYIKPENEDEFWEIVKLFLEDSWGYCDGNTAYVTIDSLKEKQLISQ